MQVEVVYCRKCKNQVESADTFCKHCGEDQRPPQVTAPAPTNAVPSAAAKHGLLKIATRIVLLCLSFHFVMAMGMIWYQKYDYNVVYLLFNTIQTILVDGCLLFFFFILLLRQKR
jgi:hypothetical protein